MKDLIRELQETLGTPGSGHPTGWSGFYVFGVGAGMPKVPDGSGWPFRTKTAVRVWEYAVKLIPKHPELDEKGLLGRAIKESGVNALDLSPEDWRLLEMAIEWRKNGIKGVKMPRIGGAPGGPFNQFKNLGYGHDLQTRGAP